MNREISLNETRAGWWVQIVTPEGGEVHGPMSRDAARHLARDLEGEAS